jgi:hypothetical protein
LVISLASQLISQLPALPAAFADDDGHFPLPGTSPTRMPTQVSTNDSIPAAVPGQPDVFANADENFVSALVRQFGSTDVFFALAFE